MSESPKRRVLITGSSGLIGSALRDALRLAGFEPVGLDRRGQGDERGDVRNRADLERAAEGVVGIVHLAAVSRVVEAQRDPDLCWETNVEATRGVLQVAEAANPQAWVVYASSREVYGQHGAEPVREDVPLRPMNIYGRSKAEAERLCRVSPVNAAILRFSNVYGSTHDHADRVVPAFARSAVEGVPLRVDGRNHTFDFTHLSDTVRGVVAVVERLDAGQSLPPIHLVTGRSTTLGELADLAVTLSGSGSRIREAPPRTYDVSGFRGSPHRAAELLQWRARVDVRTGLSRLMDDFRSSHAP